MNRRLKRWGIALGIAIVVITPVVILARHWMDASTTGSVHTGGAAASDPNALATPPPTPPTITSAYFTATLPSGFTLKRQTTPPSGSGTTLLQVLATSAGTSDQQLAITVGRLPSSGLSAVGDYNLRRTQTSTYRGLNLASAPVGATAFQTISGAPAFNVFSTQGGRYVEVSLSTAGGATLAQLESSYQQLRAQWQD